MQTQLSLDERRAVVITPKREAKVRFARESKMRASRRMSAIAIAALAAAALWGAKSAQAQPVPLFSTQDDWSSANGWAASSGATLATVGSTVFDSDLSSTNAAGNFAASGTAATTGAGALQITIGATGNTPEANDNSIGQDNNAAFISAFDPGGSPTNAANTAVAYNGLLQIVYTVPTGATSFHLGLLIQYAADGYYGGVLTPTSEVPVSTGVNNTGETEMRATIPYTVPAGQFSGFGFNLYTNTNAAAGSIFYVDSLTTQPAPADFTDQIASWTKNGNGAWETAGNWSSTPNIPGSVSAIGSQVTFGVPTGTAVSHPIVTLGQSASAVLLDFQSPDGGATSGYTINSSNAGAINISAQLEADSGIHTINVPIVFTGVATIYVAPGASVTAPTVSNPNQYGLFQLSNTDGSTLGGTFSEGGMAFCSIGVNGTWNILSSMQTVNTSANAVEFFGATVSAGGLLNLGNHNLNTNALYGAGTVEIDAGGSLQVGFFNTPSYFNGSFTGSGSVLFTGLVAGTPAPTSQNLYGTSPAFSGPVTVNGGDFVDVGSGTALGNGSATNTLTLDDGGLTAIGSFVGTQNIIITTSTGSTSFIDTDGPGGGGIVDPVTNPIIPGGCAITVGTISSTAAGAMLNKVNAGSVTATSIRGVGLSIAGGTSLYASTVKIAANNGTLAGAQAGVSVLSSLTIESATGNYTSTLDLTNNSLIVQGAGSAGAATIAAEIASGRNNNAVGGLWTGTGLTSSSAAAAPSNTALGMDLNDNGSGSPLVTTFEGQTVADGDVLVKYTYTGDADLSGKINATDYTLIDNGFNSQSTANPLTGWRNGDFNYDGVVNGDDYTLIDNAFNTQGSVTFLGIGTQPASQIALNTEQVSAVPEPGTLGLIALSGLLMSRRRSRR